MVTISYLENFVFFKMFDKRVYSDVSPLPNVRNHRAGFLNLDTMDVLDQIVLCDGGCPVHCSMLSSIPDLYPLDAGSTPTTTQYDTMSPTLPSVPRGVQNCPQLRIAALDLKDSSKKPRW